VRRLAIIQQFLRSLFFRRQLENDLDTELRDHLQREIESNIRAGMSPQEAKFAAQRLTGSVSLFEEQCRDARGTRFIDSTLWDSHYAVRTLRRTPLFTLIAIVTLALGIGAIIGAGIFVITGQAAAQFAGPAILFSFCLAGIACAFAGLCYAEFASIIPIAGSAYTYSYATLGELVAWIIGWDLILEYAFGAATVAVGWSGHLRAFLHDLGMDLPPIPHSEFIMFGKPIHLTYDYIGFLVIAVITTILVIGIKESARVTSIIVVIKIAVVLFFIVVGALAVDPANWSPFMPNGFAGVGAAAAIPIPPTSASEPGASRGGPITMLKSGSWKPPGLRATPRTWVTTPIAPSRQYRSESAGSHVLATRSERTPATPAIVSAGESTTGVHIHLSPKDPRNCPK